MGIDYVPTKEDTKYFSWCVDNGIRIYMKPVEPGWKNKLYYICIEVNKKEHCDFKKTYDKHQTTAVIYEYYRYYYKKYKK